MDMTICDFNLLIDYFGHIVLFMDQTLYTGSSLTCCRRHITTTKHIGHTVQCGEKRRGGGGEARRGGSIEKAGSGAGR